MEPINIQEIAGWCRGELRGPAALVISAISIDSRTIPPAALFIAIKGEKLDGHDYVAQVVQAGARAVVVSKQWHASHASMAPAATAYILVEDTIKALQDMAHNYRKKFKITVIAVTGSNGKTTTKNMIAQMLATQYKVHKTEGNKNNYIGLPLTLLNLDRTHQFAVIEMGMSYPGEIDMLARIADPDIGVITNVNPCHLEVLKTVENVARAKLELLRAMRHQGLGILNADNEQLMRHKNSLPVRIKTFGLENPADLKGEGARRLPDGGYEVTVGQAVKLTVPLLGKFNVLNALAATLAARECKVSLENIKQALQLFQPEKMRLQRVAVKDLMVLNDSYNANPASVRAALAVLADEGNGHRKIAVLGDMLELGEESSHLHYQVGQYLATLGIDYFLAYGTEAKFYAGGALKSGMDKAKIFYFTDKDQLIGKLQELAAPQDVVLLKGSRRMKMEEILTKLQG